MNLDFLIPKYNPCPKVLCGGSGTSQVVGRWERQREEGLQAPTEHHARNFKKVVSPVSMLYIGVTFIHSFIKYLLNSYGIPGSMLSIWSKI